MSKDNINTIPTDDYKLVITIGRQFGSGGRELGKKIADLLGIKYYDKELLRQAAEQAGIDQQIVENNDEHLQSFISTPDISFSLGGGNISWYQNASSISGNSIQQVQSDVIQRLATSEACVIVGRAANYVLRNHPLTVNIFVHAPIESCLERIMSRTGITSRQKAEKLRQRTNRLRANYYNFYTDKRWGDASSYDLCFDTSRLSTDAIAQIVAHYVGLRFPHLKLQQID